MELIDYIKEYVKNEEINLLPHLAKDLEETKKTIFKLSDEEFIKISDYFIPIIDMTEDQSFVDCISERFLEIKDSTYDLYDLYQIIKYGRELFQEEF